MTALGVGAVSVAGSNEARAMVAPPGASSLDHYLSNCIKCGRCVQECPPNALDFAGLGDGLLRAGAPKLVPEKAGCITWEEACLECIDACPTDVLSPIPTDEAGIPESEVIGRAQVDEDRCINCNNCYPICPVDAVLTPDEGDRPTYSIDEEACVGCGRCIEICPVEGNAIELFEPDATPEYPITMEGRG